MVSSNLANDQMIRFILIKNFFNEMGGNREIGLLSPGSPSQPVINHVKMVKFDRPMVFTGDHLILKHHSLSDAKPTKIGSKHGQVD